MSESGGPLIGYNQGQMWTSAAHCYGTFGVVGSGQLAVMLSLSKHGAPFGRFTLREVPPPNKFEGVTQPFSYFTLRQAQCDR